MKILQLQYLNDNNENAGGLYLDAKFIVSVDSAKFHNELRCHIRDTTGTVYIVVNDFTQVLDDWTSSKPHGNHYSNQDSSL